jgi:predicted ATPase/class 3 adenylate cyclase
VAELVAGTVTLVFTDIEGSTLLLERLQDRYATVLSDHHRLLREAFGARGGSEHDAAGDGLYFTFPSARAALAGAVDAQRAILGHPWPDGVAVRVRMGLHTGEPVSADVGLVGLDVHRAARIAAAGHGGQILLSQTVRDLVGREVPAGVSLVDLGQHRLKDLADSQHIFQAVAEGLPAEFPALRTIDARPNNLPRQLSSFVGRQRELGDARALLQSTPLLTLTGPGGVGKTRLSLQIAADVLDEFQDGCWVVELGALADEGLVLESIAAALGVAEQPGRPLSSTLVDHLRTRRLLVVLDNCEHLLEACARHAHLLLMGCPTLRILATSREALGISGESVFPVPSLGLPDADRPATAEQASRWEAVHLFVDRAAAVDPSFRLTDQNARAVIQVCQRLDGIPLALELAAARVRALPVEQIAARLDDRFRLLTGGSRVAVTRHQTLRATIDWSYDLLSDAEREVLRRMSVFAGGGTLAAAEAVCPGGEVTEGDVLDLLSRLVDKSLVVSDTLVSEASSSYASGAEGRFRLLETVRQYARERLLDSGEAEDAFRRHRDWYLALIERAKPDFFSGPPPARWLEVFDSEHDNLRAALEWSSTEPGGTQAGLRMTAGLWRYWEIRGHFVEGRRWLERTLAATDGEVSGLRANALTGAGVLAHFQGDYPAALAFSEESLALHRELGHRPSVTYALHNLANIAAEQGSFERARELYAEGIEMARSMGDQRGVAIGLLSLADVVSRQGDDEQAGPLFDESLETLKGLGDRWGMAFAMDSSALAAARHGDLEAARARHEQALAISRELGDERGVARTLIHLADLASMEGDATRAISLHRECLRIRRALRDMPGVASGMEKLARVVGDEAAEDAARLLGSAEALRESIHAPLPPAARAEYEASVLALVLRLGERGFETARLEGRAMAPDQALAAVIPEELAAPAP